MEPGQQRVAVEGHSLAMGSTSVRIRSIKPEFFMDEELATLPPTTRLLYIGLWCLADGHGRLEDRPAKIKASLLPYEEWDVGRALDDLHAARFVIRYEADGKKLIQVRTFASHQRITGKEAETPSKYPAPTGDISRDQHSSTGGNNGETSGNQSGNSQCPGREGKGKEGKGENFSPPPADDITTPGPPPQIRPEDRARYDTNELKQHGADVAPWNQLRWTIVIKMWGIQRVCAVLDSLPIKKRTAGDVDSEIRKGEAESELPTLEEANKLASENADYLIDLEKRVAEGRV